MKVLGFDTATDHTVVAATSAGEPLFERSVPPDAGRPLHSQALLAMVDEAATVLGGWEAVDRLAVGIGPGTFTGIRIGVATAAGLAATSDVAVTGVSSLSALALTVAGLTGAERVLPLIDARRGEVFGCLHDGNGKPLEEPFVCGPEDLPSRLPGAEASSPVVAGSGAVRFRDELLRAGFNTEPDGSPVHRLAGRSICELGAAADRTGTETLKPLYLRVPDAQLWLERDGKTN